MSRIALCVGALLLIFVCLPVAGSAETEQEGIKLLEEGKALHDKPFTSKYRQETLEKYEQAQRIFEKVGAEKLKATALKEIGHLYNCSFDRPEKGLEYLNKSREIFRNLGDLNGEAEVLIELAKVHSKDRPKALGCLNESLDIVRKAGDLKGEAQVLTAMGDLPGDDTQKPREYHEQALQIYKKLGDSKGEAQILTKIALHHWDDSRKKIQYYEKALQIYRKLGDLNGEAHLLKDMGSTYYGRKNPRKGREYYEKSLQIFRNLGDLQGEEHVLHYVCWDAWRAHEFSQALACFEKRMQVFKKLDDLKGECKTLDDISSTFMAWGGHEKNPQYSDKGLEYAVKAMDCIKKTGDPADEIDILDSVALRFNIPEIPRYYEFSTKCRNKAMEMAKTAGDVRSQRSQLNQMHWEAFRALRFRTALEYASKELELDKAMGDPKAEYITLQRICDFHKSLGEYQKALECHEKRLEVCRRLGISPDDNMGGVTVGAAGFDVGIYGDLGQDQKVLELLQEKLEAYEKIHGVGSESDLLLSMGSVYAIAGQFYKALECYRKYLEFIDRKLEAPDDGKESSKRMSSRILDRNHIILAKRTTLITIGGLHAQMGQYDKALAAYEATLKVRPEKGNEWWDQFDPSSQWDLSTESLIGSLYLDMGQIAKAEPYIRKVGGDELLARLFLMKADYVQAREHYAAVIASAERLGLAADLFGAYTGAGLAYESMGDFSAAAQYFQKAVDLTEEQRSFLRPAEREHFLGAIAGGYRRTTPYEGLARVRLKLNMLPDAFKISEYTKARLFAEATSRRVQGQRFDIPAEVLRTDAEINDGIAAVKKLRREQAEKGNMQALEAIDDEIKDLEAKRAKHMRMLRERYPLFAATRYPEPMDLSQTALEPQEWALAYDVTDPGVIVYVTKGRQVVKAIFKPIPRTDLAGLIRNFREPLELTGEDDVKQKLTSFDFVTGKKLFDLLVGGVLDSIPQGAPLIVVPDDELGVLPFEMLVMNTGGRVMPGRRIPQTTGATFFGDRNPMSYYQSVTALTLARTYGKERGQAKKLLVMADPVFELMEARAQNAQPVKLAGREAQLYKELMAPVEDGGCGLTFPRLPRTGDLARNLEGMYPGSCEVRTGLSATKDNFMKEVASRLTEFDKVVFATHGYFGKDIPGIKEPVLVLTLVPPGTDGYLRMSEVMGLKLDAGVVALTACQTGLGKAVSGEGTMSMGRAFQYAGARSVLISLWSVEQEASVRLVGLFFKHLKDGRPNLDALRLAREEIRKGGFDHPMFWAPFILVGETL